eukprot:COSAG01_NODE_1325_length_10718_cov_50.476787_5_plen_181_part_00
MSCRNPSSVAAQTLETAPVGRVDRRRNRPNARRLLRVHGRPSHRWHLKRGRSIARRDAPVHKRRCNTRDIWQFGRLLPTASSLVVWGGRKFAVTLCWQCGVLECGMSLRQGVARQVAAFSEAVRQVLPPEKLLAFTTSELLENVCGESVHWDSSTVRECIVRSCHHPRLSRWMPLPLLPP